MTQYLKREKYVVCFLSGGTGTGAKKPYDKSKKKMLLKKILKMVKKIMAKAAGKGGGSKSPPGSQSI